MVDPHMDSATYTFGSTEEFERYMEAYFSGEYVELEGPEVGAIALYLNDDYDLVHIGRVVLDSDGIMTIDSKDRLVPMPSLTDVYAIPFHDASSVLWVGPIEE